MTLRHPFAALAAILACTSFAAAQPANDECSSATSISGNNISILYDSTGATTSAEGQTGSNCAFQGLIGIENDIWYCWTATCDGFVQIQTPQGTG